MANERTAMYLHPEGKQALAEYVERTKAESISAAANDLIGRGLAAVSTQGLDTLAVPAIEEALGRRVEEVLTAALRPLHEAIAAAHREAALARLEGFAHLSNDYGFEHAQHIEGVATVQAATAVQRGELPRMGLDLMGETEAQGRVA